MELTVKYRYQNLLLFARHQTVHGPSFQLSVYVPRVQTSQIMLDKIGNANKQQTKPEHVTTNSPAASSITHTLASRLTTQKQQTTQRERN